MLCCVFYNHVQTCLLTNEVVASCFNTSRFAAMSQNKLHVFVAHFTVPQDNVDKSPALLIIDCERFEPRSHFEQYWTVHSTTIQSLQVSKKEFVFVLLVYKTLKHLFSLIQWAKCRRIFLEMNSEGCHPSWKRKKKFHRRMFTSSIVSRMRKFQVVVMQWTLKEMKRQSVMYVQSCCFALKTSYFFTLPSLSSLGTLRSDNGDVHENVAQK